MTSQDKPSPNPYESPQFAAGLDTETREPRDAQLVPPIHASGKLTKSDLSQAFALLEGRNSNGSGFPIVTIVVLVGMVIGAMAFIAEHPTAPVGYLWLAVAGGLLYFIGFYLPMLRRAFIAKRAAAAVDAEFVFSTDGIAIRTVGKDDMIRWNEFRGFRDSKSVVVFDWIHGQIPVAREWFNNEADFERLVYFLGHKIEMLDSPPTG
ncbi:MAG TPA: hypothetical protein VGI40_20850 [Pirellulaceae bacterium]|jgi:hypothetical protein